MAIYKRSPHRKGDPVEIPVSMLEYREGGNTLWVHGPDGCTILRLKVTGAITSQRCDTSPVAHADAVLEGDLTMCVPKRPRQRVQENV